MERYCSSVTSSYSSISSGYSNTLNAEHGRIASAALRSYLPLRKTPALRARFSESGEPVDLGARHTFQDSVVV
jgi:hypothetical protein